MHNQGNQRNPLTQPIAPKNLTPGRIWSEEPSIDKGFPSQSESPPSSQHPSQSIPMTKAFRPSVRQTVPYTAALDPETNSTVENMFDVFFTASSAVSSFRSLLLEHRRAETTEQEKLFERVNNLEFLKYSLLTSLKQVYSSERGEFSPVDFFVRMIGSLDSMRETTHSARSVFAICVNDVTVCEKCWAWKRSAVNLGALRITDFQRFEMDITSAEISYFNLKPFPIVEVPSAADQSRYFSAFQKANSRRPLQHLLIDRYCIHPCERKQCTKCYRESRHLRMLELQSLSSGFVLVLPERGWTAGDVPAGLDLKDSPVAGAVYRFRAAVSRGRNAEESGRWVCVTNLSQLVMLADDSPLLLFYERDDTLRSEGLERERHSAIELKSRYEKLRIALKRRKAHVLAVYSLVLARLKQAVLATKQAEAPTDRDPTYPQRLQETLRETTHLCSGSTAGLEAALRGLFTIRAFTACLEKGLLAAQYPNTFLDCLNSLFESHLQRFPMDLRGLARSVQVQEKSLLQYVNQLLSLCDSSRPSKSNTDFSRVSSSALFAWKNQRKGKCEVLHDVFSVLVKGESGSDFFSDRWSYSRLLDIPLVRIGNAEVHTAKTPTSSHGCIINLEDCIEQISKPISLLHNQYRVRYQPKIAYLGIALVIRIFDGGANRPPVTLVRVPRVLDMKVFGIVTSPEYRLRAIIHSKEALQTNTFLVQEIDASEGCIHQHGEMCGEVLLFYEREKGENFITSSYQTHEHSDSIKRKSREKSVKDKRDERSARVDFRYGLRNLGNTCFMNAALNGLYSLHSFRAFFSEISAVREHPLLSALEEFCRRYTEFELPQQLLSKFKTAIPEFSDGRQHCANSYTFNLLMQLDQIMAATPVKRVSSDIFEEKLRRYREGKCEPLHDIFSALAENLFICKLCFNVRQNFSYFRTVDVPIPSSAEAVNGMTVFNETNFYPGDFANNYTGTKNSEKVYRKNFSQIVKNLKNRRQKRQRRNMDLSLCLEYMLRASLMSAENTMPCDNCGRETQHYKQSFFRQLSTALVIHFQRFDERTRQKLNTSIAFPMELDMSAYCVNDKRQYALRAVVYHKGLLDSGHYTAWINVGGRWYEADDYHVREGSSPPIENAYMLFYEEATP